MKLDLEQLFNRLSNEMTNVLATAGSHNHIQSILRTVKEELMQKIKEVESELQPAQEAPKNEVKLPSAE